MARGGRWQLRQRQGQQGADHQSSTGDGKGRPVAGGQRRRHFMRARQVVGGDGGGDGRHDGQAEGATHLAGGVDQARGQAGLVGGTPAVADRVMGTNDIPMPSPMSTSGPSTWDK